MIASTTSRCTVVVDDIHVEAFIGVYGHEKNRRQSLILSVSIDVVPPDEDCLQASVNYELVVSHCKDLAEEGIALIETFGMRLCALLLNDDKVVRACVQVTKNSALPNGKARAVCEQVRSAI